MTTAAPTTIPRLRDRFEIGPEIGDGSYARVFAARDKRLGIEVAVKVLRLELVRSPRVVAAFTREAAIAARMVSPHAVKVLGLAVTDEGAPCIAFERLVGRTLADRLDREGGLTLADTADLVKQTCRALSRAHAIGVVHRDVKPENLFLVDQPKGRPLVKLLDYGVADMVDASGVVPRDELVGTPEYMAPEILLGTHRADPRADLYAVGVVAFECLTGRRPISGSIDDLILGLRRDARPSLAALRPDLPRALDAWMDRALQRDPFFRFASARQMAEALEAALAGAAPVLRRAA